MPVWNTARIQILKSLLADAKDDPFPVFALALEYRSAEFFSESREYFLKCLSSFPDYLPAYFPFAEHLFESGEAELAAEICEKGIRLAVSSGNKKTALELKSLLEINTA